MECELSEQFKRCDDKARLFVAECLESIGFDMELWRTDDSDIERIESAARGGFSTFTDGGWRAMPFGDIGSAQGSGRHGGMLTGEIERMQLDAMQSYIFDNDLSDDAFSLLSSECWELIEDKLADDMESFYEYESEYMTSAFYVDIRATYYAAGNCRNKSGRDEVLLSVWLNLDEYGRESAASCVWSKLVLASSLARATDEQVKSVAYDASAKSQKCNAVQCA